VPLALHDDDLDGIPNVAVCQEVPDAKNGAVGPFADLAQRFEVLAVEGGR
jgi:hypothetical protein